MSLGSLTLPNPGSMLGVLALAAVATGAGLASVSVHPAAPVGIAVGLGFVALLVRDPFTALLAFIAVLFTRPAEFFPVLAALQPAKVLALLTVGVLGLARLVARDLRLARSPHNGWLLFLAVACFASASLGSHPTMSRTLFTDVFVKLLIVHALVVNLVDSRDKVVRFQRGMAGLVLFLAGFALYAKATGAVAVEGSRAALVGMLGDPNDLALACLTATPYLVADAMDARGARRPLAILLALTAIGGIGATQSRGGFLGLGAGLMVLLWPRVRSKAAVFGIVGVGLIVMVVAGGLVDRQSGAIGAGEIDESAQGRLDAWVAGFQMLKAHPLLGVGLNAFAQNFEGYAIDPVFWGEHETHNTYIKSLAEVGLLGTTPYMVLLALSVRNAIRLFRLGVVMGPCRERALLTSQLACFGAVLVSAFFLSQTWGWFIAIGNAQLAAFGRVYRVDGAVPPLADPEIAAAHMQRLTSSDSPQTGATRPAGARS